MSVATESVNEIQTRVLADFHDAARSAADSLRAISEISLRQAEALDHHRFGYTDFISQPAQRYHDQLVKMETLNSVLSKLNWLARQVAEEGVDA